MAGLDPAIHVLLFDASKNVDARHEAGHDDLGYFFTLLASILTDISSSLVENAVSTANGFSMPR